MSLIPLNDLPEAQNGITIHQDTIKAGSQDTIKAGSQPVGHKLLGVE